MKISEDLTALVFELRRSHSPADKAKALARAWRTVRGLSHDERRLLAREVGFDGAEDLVEGLAGKSAGVFAPAAVLEALGRMRRDESLTIRGVLSDLRDRERREDLLARGVDLLVGDGEDGGGEAESTADEDRTERSNVDFEPGQSTAKTATPAEEATLEDATLEPEVEAAPVEVSPLPEVPALAEEPAHEASEDAEPGEEPRSDPEASVDVESEDPSNWDEIWLRAPTGAPVVVVDRERPETWSADDGSRPRVATGPVFRRLRAFRNNIEELRSSGGEAVIAALDLLPEPWAKRRAMIALIEAGIPANIDDALDLIENLARPMDRSWCLSALARRGDLEGADLERALNFLSSPAARRRVKALAGV